MNYELLLEDVKSVPKNTLKRIIFDLEQEKIGQIKNCQFPQELEKKLILMQKDRSFLDMLLVNALVEDQNLE